MSAVAAVDLGATSGRVLVADWNGGTPTLAECARFRHAPVEGAGGWHWDLDTLLREIDAGVARAVGIGAASIGIDAWGVDYGVRREEVWVGPVRSYRDPRNAEGMAIVESRMPWRELYAHTGIQHLALTTINQIAVDDPERWRRGSVLVPLPDVIAHHLTGVLAADATHASTMALLDPRTRDWCAQALAVVGLSRASVLPLQEPGIVRGTTSAGVPVIAVGGHDTASAYAGTPLLSPERALVVSLGTWALVGAETRLAEPDERAFRLNLTHELGVDGTVRLLRNVAGMWLLEECRTQWGRVDGTLPDVGELVRAAEQAPAFAAVIDVDDPVLATPGQSEATVAPRAIGTWPTTRAGVVRVLLESLVIRLAERLEEIDDYLGGGHDTVHVVGGGSRIDLLMQSLADATGRRVVAGPVEATALGNAAVQWQARGTVASLAEARTAIAELADVRTFEPRGDRRPWQALAARLREESRGGSTDPGRGERR